MEFWISGISILVLLVLSGFFSGAETALTAASRARMYSLAKKGDKRAAMVQALHAKKDSMIGALLLGNNLVNILASAMATSLLIKTFGEAGVVYATLGMTLLVLIFAEVLPKTYALNNADKVATSIAPIIRILVIVFSPITDAIARVVRIVLKMIGARLGSNENETEEELRGAIDLHHEQEEEVDAHQARAMMRSILDLGDVEVEEIMVHRRNVAMINADLPFDKIVQEVLDSSYTRLPLWRNDQDNIIGVLHSKLLLKELQKCGGDTSKIDLSLVMIDPWFIPETTTLFDQLQEFRKKREHFALMVDEYGALVGVVTLEDILEEIVGEIDDEHDIATIGIKPQSDGSYLIDGDVTIRDLNRDLDWVLPDEEYATLAGLLLFETQTIPKLRQVFTFFGFRFEVVRKQRNQLSLLRVIPPEQVQ